MSNGTRSRSRNNPLTALAEEDQLQTVQQNSTTDRKSAACAADRKSATSRAYHF